MTFISNCDNCIETIKPALERYFDKDINDNINICIIPLCPEQICSNDGWNKFFKDIKNNIQQKINSNTSNLNSSNINCLNENAGIIFYTTESIPRGDYPNSMYNSSRMLRNFFENTTYAKTANHENLIDKIKELIVEIKNNKKKNLSDALKDLESLLEKELEIESQSQKLKNLFEELSQIYTYQNFHTLQSHSSLRTFGKFLDKDKLDDDALNQLKYFQREYYLKRQKHDIASIIATNPLRFEKLNILIIDDNPNDVIDDLKKIKNFLPPDSQIFITNQHEYKKFLNDKEFIKKLFNGEAELKLKEINNNNANSSFQDTLLFDKIDSNSFKFKFDYVIVDLLLGHYNEGNKIIRELVKLRNAINKNKKHNEKSFFFILVLSLSDDVDDIFRSYNEGALGYVWKFGRIYQLPALIGIFEEFRQKLIDGIGISAHSHARNFSKLYHLPPEIEWRLRTEYLLAPVVKNKFEIEDIAKIVARNWIKKIPKAELHYHLGGSMDEKIIFYLSVNTVAHLCKKHGQDVLNDGIINTIKSLVEKYYNNKDYNDNYEKFFRKFYECCLNIVTNNCKNETDINTWLENLSNTKEKKINYLKKHEDKPAEVWFDYLTYLVNKDKNPDQRIKKSDLIAVFFVYAGILAGKSIEDAKRFWETIKSKVDLLKSNDYPQIIKEYIEKTKIYGYFKNNGTIEIPALKLNECELQSINNNLNIKLEDLKGLILASSEAKTLNQLLRGDVFFGADNLQYYENIFACVWYLMEQAVEDNVRYLEIRVSPSGYTKENLTIIDATQALLEAADLCSLYHFLKKNKFIWTNFITTAKRHKTPHERAVEIALATVIRERSEFVKKIEANSNLGTLNFGYTWKASRIVGVDLAGYEQTTPPSMFEEDFLPLFKVCSFITIHAGEEASSRFIWEAYYKLKANRIGHGLTIIEHKSLMELARDTQVCIELCPHSNKITNNLRGERIKLYPLYKFLKEGLNITINTDDKATTGKTLSDEYVQAAEFFYFAEDNKVEIKQNEIKQIPLTKWETLRLVKAGFDNAFITRTEKHQLLSCVEEEIYQKVLQLYEVEPIYFIDF